MSGRTRWPTAVSSVCICWLLWFCAAEEKEDEEARNLGKCKKYSTVPPHSSNPTVNKKPLLSSSLAPRYVGLRLRSAYCVSWSGDSAQAWRVPTQRPGLIGTYWGPCSQIKTYHSFHQPSPWDSVFLDVQEVRLQSSSLELWRFFHREVS